MRGRHVLIALSGAVLTAVATLPARAQTPVTVNIANDGGQRTVFVEDLLGNDLTASGLNFGSTRQLPFRIRVVDSPLYDRTGFTVAATMTNLYLQSGQSLDFANAGNRIASLNLSMSYPLNGALGLSNVVAVVKPLLNVTGTLPAAVCAPYQVATNQQSCAVTVNGLAGKLQRLNVPVNLNSLGDLPLVPQVGTTGPFTSPDYAGVAAGHAPGGFVPTSLGLLSGSVPQVPSNALVSTMQTALNTVVAGANAGNTSATALFDSTSVISGGVRAALVALPGGTAAVSAFDGLTGADSTALLASASAAAQSLNAGQIIGQGGTYLSFPYLNVTIPNASPKGGYQGSLVVTSTQP